MVIRIRALIDPPDPIGEVLDTEVLENGLEIQKVRVVWCYGIIYESRPNVTSMLERLPSRVEMQWSFMKDATHSAQAIVTAPLG